MEAAAEFTLPYKIPKTEYTLKELTTKDIPAALGALCQAFTEFEPLAVWTKWKLRRSKYKKKGLRQEILSKGAFFFL